MNHKKTKIIPLPINKEEDWVRHLNSFNLETSYGEVNYKLVKSYLDLAVELTIANNNASALYYALKVLSQKKLTKNGQALCIKEAFHFSFIYPYIIPALRETIFDVYNVDIDILSDFLNKLYATSMENKNYEGAYYCFYYAMNHDLKLFDIDVDEIIASDNCILKIISYLYYKKNGLIAMMLILENNAINLKDNNCFDENWLFIYEVLDSSHFDGYFKAMKCAGVSFIK